MVSALRLVTEGYFFCTYCKQNTKSGLGPFLYNISGWQIFNKIYIIADF